MNELKLATSRVTDNTAFVNSEIMNTRNDECLQPEIPNAIRIAVKIVESISPRTTHTGLPTARGHSNDGCNNRIYIEQAAEAEEDRSKDLLVLSQF